MKRMPLLLILLSFLTLSGCVHRAEPSKQEKFLAASPRSILVVPVVNNSVDVTASDYMLSTLATPLAERGYYVFPINAVKRVLEDEGLADSSLVHSAPASKLASLFGADAVLYIVIEQWDAKYMVLTTTVTVAIDYQIRDGKTDDVLWENKERMVYQPQGGNSSGGGVPGLVANLIVKAAQAAMTKAAPNYMPLAHQANAKALLRYPGTGIPAGPYATAEELKKEKSINEFRNRGLIPQDRD
jgi:hypothetical protein